MEVFEDVQERGDGSHTGDKRFGSNFDGGPMNTTLRFAIAILATVAVTFTAGTTFAQTPAPAAAASTPNEVCDNYKDDDGNGDIDCDDSTCADTAFCKAVIDLQDKRAAAKAAPYLRKQEAQAAADEAAEHLDSLQIKAARRALEDLCEKPSYKNVVGCDTVLTVGWDGLNEVVTAMVKIKYEGNDAKLRSLKADNEAEEDGGHSFKKVVMDWLPRLTGAVATQASAPAARRAPAAPPPPKYDCATVLTDAYRGRCNGRPNQVPGYAECLDSVEFKMFRAGCQARK